MNGKFDDHGDDNERSKEARDVSRTGEDVVSSLSTITQLEGSHV